jgi:hypothetical protein
MKCGGPRDDVDDLLNVTIAADLVDIRDGRVRLTKAGQRIATQDRQQGGALLARSLIKGGFFAEQARLLLEVSTVSDDHLECRREHCHTLVPQLVGLLRCFPDVAFEDALRVPAALATELLTDVWALVPVRSPVPDARKAIGDRGEAYSYQYERAEADDPSNIRWVARDDETLGYDIEDLTDRPSRKIEVKASGAATVRFFLSAHEYDVAQVECDRYEVHYWGGLDLSRSIRDEYALLRRLGFPVVFRDPAALVAAGVLEMVPSDYIVTQPVPMRSGC